MRIGVVLPQTELGGDVRELRAYATGAEALGYGHLMLYDHVLGADPAVHVGWDGSYDVDTTFHEPMVALGFLAGVTRLELVTGVLILPQRQTALVAKQAAELDLLTEGRLRLGVGIVKGLRIVASVLGGLALAAIVGGGVASAATVTPAGTRVTAVSAPAGTRVTGVAVPAGTRVT
jgi:hypothetical protein